MIKKKIRMDEATVSEVPAITIKPGSRIDMMGLDLCDDYMQSKMVKTPEGFLKGRAIVTNVGVFKYTNADGTVVNELRPPEEVFHQDSIASLCMLPITNNHPMELVDSENIKKYQIGHLGDGVCRDAYHLSAPVVITDADAVSQSENGKIALSCGYTVDVEPKSGVWMGVAYDAIQRNIRYNHLALVDRARAGDAAKLKMDSAHAVCLDVFDMKPENEKSNMEDPMKKVKIDGVEYEAEAKVIETLTKADSRIDEMTKQSEKDKADHATALQALQGKLDSAVENCEKLKKDVADLQAKEPTSINDAVNAKLALLDSARSVGVEVKADMSDEDIRKAVIVKAFPKAVEKMDKADPAYIAARFDAALELLATEDKNRADNRQQAADLVNGTEVIWDTAEVNSDDARAKMIKNMQEAHKIPVVNK